MPRLGIITVSLMLMCVIVGFISGCVKQDSGDRDWRFGHHSDKVEIILPDGEVVEGTIKLWEEREITPLEKTVKMVYAFILCVLFIVYIVYHIFHYRA